jgi:DNA-binding NarL/FixJ family response regulator
VFVRRQASGGPFMAHAWHASVLASMGRLDEAAAAFAHVAAHVRAFPRHTVEWIIATTVNVNLCVLLHRQDLLPGLYEELLPFAGRQVTGHAHTPSQGPVDLYLGRVALALGDRAAAQKHLDHSLRLAGEMGSAPYEAITRLELARLLSSGSHAEDHGNATAHLEAAHQTARRLGMRPLAAQTAAMLTASRTFPRGPLTEREHEIAGLIAEGLSNKQIATRLRLSTRTVEAHVRSIFAKLVCTSRARVAAWFVTEGAQRDRFQT